MQNALWEKKAASRHAAGWAVFGALALMVSAYAAIELSVDAATLALTCRQFALDAAVTACRWPVVWQIVGITTLITGLVSFVVAWRIRSTMG